MKKKFKLWKGELAEAKTAWTAAKKAKKPAAEIEAAYKAVQKLQLVVDEGDSNGAKDEDEIEVAGEEGSKGKDSSKTDEGGIEIDDLKAMISTTVADAVKKALPEKEQKDQVTAESIKTAIEVALAKIGKADADKVAASEVKGIVEATIAEQMTAITKKSKQGFDTGDENHEGKMMYHLEMPTSLSKGNLPLHMKQLLNVMKKRDMNHDVPASMLERGKMLGDRMVAKYTSAARHWGQKALTSTGSATGDEWVPTDLSSELQRRLYLSSDLASLFASREVDMPTQPFEYPLGTTRPTFYLETTENTAATASTPGTGKITLDAKKLMGKVEFSYEVEEDSIIPVLGYVQESLADAAAAAYESILINGDTTGTHMDSDTQLVAKAAERAWKGFRKLSMAITQLKLDISTGGINEANLRAIKKLMGKYGTKPRDLLWIAGPAGINDMAGIANVATLDKYGPKATIITGEIASFLGIPIIVSEANREDLNASGVYDGVTTTRGSILLVNTRYWLPGRRREFTVETDRDISSQTQYVVASFRRAFTPFETPSASIKSVAIGYNNAA